MYLTRLDGLISSYVGSTSKNIRALFEFASRHPCVLFLDEFDAIAKLRGDGQEMGELKRVVNSFIQNLDTLGSQSIIVAATNHQELLDAAVWRRFGYRLELDYPTPEMRSQLWQHFAKQLAFGDRELELLVDLSDGFSGSDIHEVATRLYRRQLLGNVTATLREALRVMRNLCIGEGDHRRFLDSVAIKTNMILPANCESVIQSSTVTQPLHSFSGSPKRRQVAGQRERRSRVAKTSDQRRTDRLLIKVIMPKQGTERRVSGGGSPPKPFRPVDSEYRGRFGKASLGDTESSWLSDKDNRRCTGSSHVDFKSHCEKPSAAASVL